MAKRVFETVVTADSVQWKLDGKDEVVAEMQFKAISDKSKQPLLVYGVKQYVTDGSAMSAGASVEERINGLRERIKKVAEGTMDVRQFNRMPDASIWEAAVALGLIADNDEMRQQWRDLPAAHRKALMKDKRIAKWIAENSGDEGADDVLKLFASK